jgi:DNA invertase Pin-like site-specific DNA recombinase
MIVSNGENSDDVVGRIGLGYQRVSSKRQSIEGGSLVTQEEAAKAYFKLVKIPYGRSFADDCTGGGDFMERPAMRAMLEYIDTNPGKKFMVFVYDLKRLARDVSEHIKLRKAFQVRGVLLCSTNHTFDDSPEGKLIETLHAAVGEFERTQNRNQVKQKQAAHLMVGRWPFPRLRGYRHLKGAIIEPLEPDATHLRKALEGFASGVFVSKVAACEYLIEVGFWKKQRAEKYIHRFDEMLKNPIYAGFVEYEEWNIERRKGVHKPLITEEVFNKNLLRLRSDYLPQRPRRDINPDFPLRSLVICPCCKKTLTGAWSQGRSNRYPYYLCKTHGCELRNKSIAKHQIEFDFQSALSESKVNNESIGFVNDLFDTVWKDELSQYERKSKIADTELRKKRQLLDELADKAVGATSSRVRKTYEDKMEKVAIEIEDFEAKNIGGEVTSIDYQTALDKALLLLKDPLNTWQNLDVVEQQKVFFFIFDGKLEYSKINGFQTANNLKISRVFHEFVSTNSHDVEYFAPS